MPRALSILMLTFCLLACGPTERDTDDHVWKTQTEALEKARQIEEQLQQADQERRKAIDATERGRPAE